MKDEFRRHLFFNISIVGGSIVMGVLLLSVLAVQLEKKGQSIIGYRRLIADRSAALDNLANLRRAESDAAAYRKKLDILLPVQDDLYTLPRFLEATARTYNVSLSFSFQGTPVSSGGEQPGYQQFILRTAGTRENITDFVGYLESKATQFLINIETIELNASGNEYHGDIFGKVFFRS